MSASATTTDGVTVGDYLISRLYELGVRSIFGVPGDFVIKFCDQIEHSSIKWVGTCNELNAAYAGDGYARVNGLGAVVTTFGVGELSAANGIAGSLAEHVPVVHIVGAPRRDQREQGLHLHHLIGNNYDVTRKMMKHITVANATIDEPSTAAREIDRVLTACLKERGPVYLSVPNDVFSEKIQSPTVPLSVSESKADSKALSEALDEAVAMIESAKSHAILADVEIEWAGAQKEFSDLLDASGIPFATSLTGKALADETDPRFLGIYQGHRGREDVWRTVEGADCVLEIGVLETDMNTGGFTGAIDRSHTISTSAIGHVGVRQHWFRHVPLREFVAGLAAALRSRGFRARPAGKVVPASESAEQHSAAHTWTPEAGRALTSARLFDRLAKYFPERSVVVSDTGVAGFNCAETVLPRGALYVCQSFYISIGYSVGAALGAAVAVRDNGSGRKVVLLVGDGAFQMTAQEVSSIVRLQLPVTMVLLNNRGYTIERLIREGGFNDLQEWQYSQLPKVFGAAEAGRVASTEDELEAAVADAERSPDKAHFIEVRLQMMDAPAALAEAGKFMNQTK